MTNGSLMKVESIAVSDNWVWKTILVFFLSGSLRQVLLYKPITNYSKTCLKWSLNNRHNKGLKDKW